MLNIFHKFTYILGSASPRRAQLLQDMGLSFDVIPSDIDEVYDESIPPEEVPLFLSRLKADSLGDRISPHHLLITADSVVISDGQILGKPSNKEHATNMLQNLSNREHQVITGVSLYNGYKLDSFSVETKVFFNELLPEEIEYYILRFQPFDKAGSYGIQEWIGHCKIKKIVGSYTNVMGLPTAELYEAIHKF